MSPTLLETVIISIEKDRVLTPTQKWYCGQYAKFLDGMRPVAPPEIRTLQSGKREMVQEAKLLRQRVAEAMKRELPSE